MAAAKVKTCEHSQVLPTLTSIVIGMFLFNFYFELGFAHIDVLVLAANSFGIPFSKLVYYIVFKSIVKNILKQDWSVVGWLIAEAKYAVSLIYLTPSVLYKK